MKRPVVLEAAQRTDGTPGVFYRFTCATCQVEGAWHESLNDAERSGERHNRMRHPVEGARA